MSGLNEEEVIFRIKNNLINNKNIKYSRSIKDIFIKNIFTLFNFIHIILFILILTTKSLKNGTFIIAITFNVIIGIYQEIKAKLIMDKLRIVNQQIITVIRNNIKKKIFVNEILLDDLLYIETGDYIPVDVVMIKNDNCFINEAIITGENDLVFKENNEILYSGSIVFKGNAYVKVISINENTYANNMIKDANQIKKSTPYLKDNLNIIVKYITFLIIPLSILLFCSLYYGNGLSYKESILSTVGGSIGMIPDGLILLTSISLTAGMIKMASKNVIIQNLNGIERLSCIDVLCLDKTGTITDGTMSVIDVINLNNDNYDNIIANMSFEEKNSTSNAIKNYFKINEKLNITKHLSFSSENKYIYTEFNNNDIYALGAIDCLSNKKITDYNELKHYIDNGYRILTLVKCKKEFNINENEIVSFIIIKDNIRKNVQKILNYIISQDIEIKILSGDDPITVSNILKQLKIANYDKFVYGNDLSVGDSKLCEIVKNNMIFGRITPKQKERIINCLKSNKTVGMIGDGLNDILALKTADCSIAIDSEVNAPKSVSDIVMTSNDFNVLPDIINEGRRVINNIEKVSSMYLIKTIYSFLISLLCVITCYKYPFYPVQLTLINVTCVGIPSFFLALEPNYNKVKKDIFKKIINNALPSAICIFINICILMLLYNNNYISMSYYKVISLLTTGFISLRLLYKISIPYNLFKKILFIFCILNFYGNLIFFQSFYSIQKINIYIILFTLFISIINLLFIEIFEKIIRKEGIKYERKTI